MTSLVVPAQRLHELYEQAEQAFTRGGYSAPTHDAYIHAYVEAAVTERRRIEEESRGATTT